MSLIKALCQFAVLSLVLPFAANCAVAQSLGDVARQQRIQKASAVSPSRVITNEDIATGRSAASSDQSSSLHDADLDKEMLQTEKQSSAHELQQKIIAQKKKVSELEKHIREVQARLDKRISIGSVQVSESVGGVDSPAYVGDCQYSDANYYHPYQDWCDQPAKWQADIDASSKELQKEKAELGAQQEQARRLGYGNAFYDPE